MICILLQLLNEFFFLVSLYIQVVPPKVTQQPTNQTKFYGDNVTFSVTAIDGSRTDALVYQWSKDGEIITTKTHPYCTGANTSNLHINGLLAQYQGSYKCVISIEDSSTESESALLRIGEVCPSAYSVSLNINYPAVCCLL